MSDAMHQAAATADLGWLLGLTTLFFLLTFVGWTWWAYRPANRKTMDDHGLMPLDDGEPK